MAPTESGLPVADRVHHRRDPDVLRGAGLRTSPTPPRTPARCSRGGPRRSARTSVGSAATPILAGVGAAGILTNAAAVWAGMDNSPVHASWPSAFILLTTWLVAKGAEESSRTTLTLTIVQYGGLALFAVIMLIAVFPAGSRARPRVVLLGVVQPVRHPRFSAALGGVHHPGHVGGDHAGPRPRLNPQWRDGDHDHRGHLRGAPPWRSPRRRHQPDQPDHRRRLHHAGRRKPSARGR